MKQKSNQAAVQEQAGRAADNRLMRWHEVHELVGSSRSTVWRWERAGTFPRRVQTGPKSVAWRASEVYAWVAELQRFGEAPIAH